MGPEVLRQVAGRRETADRFGVQTGRKSSSFWTS